MSATKTTELQKIEHALIERKGQLMGLAPQWLASEHDADRIIQTAKLACIKDPGLLKSTPTSIVLAVHELARIGLIPDGQQAALVSFYDSHSGETRCKPMVMYQGLLDIAYRSGNLKSLTAQLVYSNDIYSETRGVDATLIHKPQPFAADRGEVVGAYAYVELTSGGRLWETMRKDEIDSIRERSRSKKASPWITDWNEMARKTLVRRIYKYLPKSPDMSRAADLGDEADRGETATMQMLTPDGAARPPAIEELTVQMAAEGAAVKE